MQFPSGPKPEPISNLEHRNKYWKRSIEPKLEKDDSPKGVVIQNDNGDFWNGNKFVKDMAKWFKVGTDIIRDHLEKARKKDQSASLTMTY